ncbi:outer membrane protein assembly factor BamA, partial [Desulfovibrio sp. 1188_IL3213]
MKKILRNILSNILCVTALVCAVQLMPREAGASQGPLVLVLPFQVNAGPEMPNAAQDVPQIITDQLKQSGMRVVPMNTARQLQRSSGETIDLATARALGRQAGAQLVIYGSFNQLGDGFSMDTRLVPVQQGEAIPAGFERNSLVALSDCASTLA